MPFYYLNDSNQPVGPMDLTAIRKLVDAGVVPPDVLVCEAGSEDWIPLSEKSEPSAEPGVPKPPRTAPPPRSAVPPRRYTPPRSETKAQASANGGDTAPTYPDWFPLASMIAGITAILAMCLPVLSILLAAPALTLGILAIRQNVTDRKPFAVTGIATASVAIVASLGGLMTGAGGGFVGNPANKYIGSWQVDLSVPIMATRWDHSVMVTFHENGSFTEVTGVQMTGANQNSALRMANGEKTTGYWKWDPGRKAIVTWHDGRNTTVYMDGANSDGRKLHTGPMNSDLPSGEAGAEFWVFSPDPNDRNALIGRHPKHYRNRTMRFLRLD